MKNLLYKNIDTNWLKNFHNKIYFLVKYLFFLTLSCSYFISDQVKAEEKNVFHTN